jgi:hypothetical protein
MKKFILYILIGLILNSFIGNVSFASAHDQSAKNEDKIILIAREYQPATVPKPDTLPGPDSNQQKNTDNTLVTTNNRTILTEKLLPKATTGVIGFVSITAFIMLIVGGVRFSVSYGNDEAIGKAKNEVIWAIVGLIISLLAYTIVKIIANIDLTTTTQ